LEVDELEVEVSETTAARIEAVNAEVTEPNLYEWTTCALPIFFIIIMPFLTGTGLANTCRNFPHCEAWGISVAYLSANVPATVMMLLLFSYPMFRLRRLNAQAGRWLHAITLFTFQVSFVVVVCSWITVAPQLHIIAFQCMTISGVFHFGFTMRMSTGKNYIVTRMLLNIIVICNLVVQLFIYSEFLQNLSHTAPWVFYFFEVLGLSCVAVFPVVWHNDVIILRWGIFKHLRIHYEHLEISDTEVKRLDLDTEINTIEVGEAGIAGVVGDA